MIIENVNIKTSVRVRSEGIQYERLEIVNEQNSLIIIKWGLFPLNDYDPTMFMYTKELGWMDMRGKFKEIPDLEQLYQSVLRSNKISNLLE